MVLSVFQALVGIPRETYYISTKVGRYGPSLDEMFDHSAEKITSEFENSLKRLGLDYVDIVVVSIDVYHSSCSPFKF